MSTFSSIYLSIFHHFVVIKCKIVKNFLPEDKNVYIR